MECLGNPFHEILECLRDPWHKIHFLLLDHIRVFYHMKKSTNNNLGLLPSTHFLFFFNITFHTKTFQAIVLLVSFLLPCAWSYHFQCCVLVSVLSDNFCSVKTHKRGEWVYTKCSVRVVWNASEGKFKLVKHVFTFFFYICCNVVICLCVVTTYSDIKSYMVTNLKVLFSGLFINSS